MKHRDRYKWLLVANLAFMLCNLIIVLAWASDAAAALGWIRAGSLCEVQIVNKQVSNLARKFDTYGAKSLTGNETKTGVAEREGFEPPIRLPVCRISSAVHSTTLPPLREAQSAQVVRPYLAAATQ